MFNYLTGYARPQRYRKVLVAPFNLQQAILEEIERTIAAHSRRASGPDPDEDELAARPDVDPGPLPRLAGGRGGQLNVRGICALRPGVEGVSENIAVISIVGRFLEHSRIYSFERPGEDPSVYIGSADLMPRNLYNRVELRGPDRGRPRARRAARRPRPLASPTTPTPGICTQTARWTAGRRAGRAAQRPARADRAPRRARRVGDARDRQALGPPSGRRRGRDPPHSPPHAARRAGLVAGRGGPGRSGAPARGRGASRRGGRRRRLHGAVGGVAPEAARARGGVVLVEAEVCGNGPSGRNGGFVNELWFGLPTLRSRFGDAAALSPRAGVDPVGRRGRPVLRGGGR